MSDGSAAPAEVGPPGPPGRRGVGGFRRSVLAGAVSQPVQRPAPLRQAVFDALVELIVTRALRPGDHLIESELATQLGVSRQPVREALQRLQSEGWVDLRPAQGAFVHVPTTQQADDLLVVRGLLERESARLAARHATAEDVERLWALQREGERSLAADDEEGLVAANAALHTAVVRLSANEFLAELLGLADRRVRWYYAAIARPRGADAWEEHAALIHAIAAGDEERAAQTMGAHTERTRESYHQLLAPAADGERLP